MLVFITKKTIIINRESKNAIGWRILGKCQWKGGRWAVPGQLRKSQRQKRWKDSERLKKQRQRGEKDPKKSASGIARALALNRQAEFRFKNWISVEKLQKSTSGTSRIFLPTCGTSLHAENWTTIKYFRKVGQNCSRWYELKRVWVGCSHWCSFLGDISGNKLIEFSNMLSCQDSHKHEK